MNANDVVGISVSAIKALAPEQFAMLLVLLCLAVIVWLVRMQKQTSDKLLEHALTKRKK